MHRSISWLAVCSILAATGLAAAEPGRLDAVAETPAVPISRIADGDDYVVLPAVDFMLTIDAACPAGARAESLSVSVADTRRSLDAEDIDGIVQTTLSLPRRQSAHLRVGKFCREGHRPEAATTLPVADVLTARLSLRCAAAEKHTIVYMTLPLAVTLECEAGSEPDSGQDDSPLDSATSF